MVFIVLGFLFAAIIFIISYLAKSLRHPIVFPLIFFTISVGLVFGLFKDTGGYEPREEVCSTNLYGILSSSSLEDSPVYVIINNDGTCTVFQEKESAAEKEDNIPYKPTNLSYCKVEIVEDENCKVPRIVEYSQRARVSLFSFGIGKKINTIVLYVPKGSVVYNS